MKDEIRKEYEELLDLIESEYEHWHVTRTEVQEFTYDLTREGGFSADVVVTVNFDYTEDEDDENPYRYK